MKIGVIGAGTMGQGIAKAFAQVEGNTVALCDIKQEWAENGLAKIKKGYEKLVAKGKIPQEKADAIVAAITPGLKENLCADCDLIVEAAFEDMKVKQTTFGELDKICKPECVFASNTSSLSITEMGNGLNHPVIGMHFFNPVPSMKLVEITPVRELLYHPAELAAQLKEKLSRLTPKQKALCEETLRQDMELLEGGVALPAADRYAADRHARGSTKVTSEFKSSDLSVGLHAVDYYVYRLCRLII